MFEVKSFWIPQALVSTFQISDEMKNLGIQFQRKNWRGRSEVLMLVHPESESFFSDLTSAASRGPRFFGTATASSRTLLMWPEADPDKIFFGKLSLAKELGGSTRTIPSGEVARSIGVTKILAAARPTLPTRFRYFPEIFGIMPKAMDRGGMILRAFPADMASGEVRVMPLFALYTKPSGQKLAPIHAMIEGSGLSAEDFVIQKILRPFVKQWLELAIDQGIVIEAHAQNVLLQIGADGLPTGTFVYRDFGGFNIDLAFRRNQGLPMPAALPIIDSENLDYHLQHHALALRQSLENYFEGGFLYGLGSELTQSGHPRLSYRALRNSLQEELRSQLGKRGIALRSGLRRNFYAKLVESVLEARENLGGSGSGVCRDLLSGR